jgi:2-polyprenyl-6-methoxyphenol hydroxylase and related FAD-dependent oxidoreductases
MNTPRQVIIVGAGPVGLSAALFLVERGIAVTVLERAPALVEDMRASTFHPSTLDMLAPRGVAARLVGEGHRAQRWQFLRLDTGEAAVFDLDVLAGETAHPFRLQCEQFRLTRAIVECLRDEPLFRIHFGAELVDFQDDGAGVRVHLRTAEGERRLDALFLVGADGASSATRRLLGMELAGATYPKTSITVVVDFPFEDHLRDMLFVNYVWTASDHYSLMRISQHWRTGFSPADGQSLEDAVALPNVRQHLARILPAAADATVVHVGAYTIQRRLVERFRVGRVLLTGDAAHLNSPAGGMGMNSGIHDARSLARALAEVLHGGDEAALDRYAAVRRQIAQDDVQVQSDRNYRRHREKDPQQREIIWRDLREVTADPARMRAYLLESSMIASVKRSEQAEGVQA